MTSAMQDRRSQLSLAAVAAILGVLIVAQLKGQTGGSELQSKTAQELTARGGATSHGRVSWLTA